MDCARGARLYHFMCASCIYTVVRWCCVCCVLLFRGVVCAGFLSSFEGEGVFGACECAGAY